MRDLRIDVARGLALVAIFINHVPSAATSITWRHYGFSDASDLFVFLAGYGAAIAWSDHFQRNPVEGMWQAATRALHLYKVHLCMVLALAGIAVAGGWLGDRPDLPSWIGLAFLTGAPVEGWWRVMVLTYLPNFADILPLYIVFIGSLGLLGPALVRWPAAALALSLTIWWLAGRQGWAPTGSPDGGTWFLNPLTWQVLFVTGFLLGRRARLGLSLPRHPLLTAAAVAYLLYAILCIAPWHRFGLFPDVAGLDPAWVVPHGKHEQEIGRLLHFAAIAYLGAVLVAPRAPWLAGAVGRSLALLGRNSLPVYVTGVLLCVPMTYLIFLTPTTWTTELVLTLSGVPVLFAIALAADQDKADRRAGAVATPKASPAPATIHAPGPALSAMDMRGGPAT
jgi:hypothetical protein